MTEVSPAEKAVNSPTRRGERLRQALPCAAACLLVLVFYCWTVATDGIQVLPDGTSQSILTKSAPHGQSPSSYYNLLSDAFLAGQMSLLVTPPKELLALPDPYDPVQNEKYRLHDASLYEGRYYLYFGATPAVVLYIPFRALQLGPLPDAMAVLIFGSGGFLWTVLLLRHVVRAHLPGASRWMEAAAIVVLGLCNFVPFLLRRPAVYEAALSCGYFFVAGGVYFLFTGLDRRRLWRLAVASAFFGLSVGARPTNVLTGLMLVAAWVFIFDQWHARRWRASVREALILSAPYAACGMMLALYNFARFGSFGEFGVRYQLSGGHVRNVLATMSHVRLIWPGLHNYFLQPCKVSPLWPFFRLKAEYPYMPAGFSAEVCGGLFSNIPITILLLLSPILVLRRRRDAIGLVMPVCCLAAFGAAVATTISYTIPATTMRYAVDFAPALLVVSMLVWLQIDAVFTRGWRHVLFRAVTGLLAIYGCLFSAGISTDGPFNSLQMGNPELYSRLEHAFLPVSNFLARFMGPDETTIIGASSPSNTDQPETGRSVLWIGEQSITLRLFASDPSQARVDAFCVAGPGLPRDQHLWHITVLDGETELAKQELAVPSSISMTFGVRRGFNVVRINLEEKGPDIAIGQETDRSSYRLIGLERLNLKLEH